ncbi:ATP-binding protein [Burkholderia pyrrocinia]|uniref:ATP-binding protein n=1 Tax=Burkholderia pyrrocinia TaxID=60550 RepID=UPI001BCFABCE|nr:ATP-binding protein [Burkholderia pyrrocinia]QVN17104.1 ATP-binding protein [Burkholderia pyrrocinia]
MSMNTYLRGRLRNTPLPRSHGLLPLFEAVVNSIQGIAALGKEPSLGEITVEIVRLPQASLNLESGKGKRGAPPLEYITGFRVIDNGVGFDDRNLESFETLDSDYKASDGCRGVGRLLWLKAFETVHVSSDFRDADGAFKRRAFTFTAAQGVDKLTLSDSPKREQYRTSVHLDGFRQMYRERSAKNCRTIANALFEHCLWYFVRDGGAPKIKVKDDQETIDLDDVYEECMYSSARRQTVTVKGQPLELTHLKLKATSPKQPFIAWCAAGRVVEDESIVGKIPGLHGRVKDDDGDFVYACYVTAPFLDQNVRPERFGFDIEEISDDLFSDTELSLADIRSAVLASSQDFLCEYLHESRKAGRERVEKFVSLRAPRYRPILGRIAADKLTVDPEISDKDLDLLLHRQLSEIEGSLLAEGHAMMNFSKEESVADYFERLTAYLEKADDIKKSDLANYVFHRKVILDILEKAIERGADGKYSKEELIHELIMPMRKTSNEVQLDSCNLWLIDERLAFHDFLASDKPLSSMPITGSASGKEPDLCLLNVFDQPILVSDGNRLPLASIVIVEIKRPMRNDAAAGDEKDPVEQALGYLDRIRTGGAMTASGRPIPGSDEIPGFCYAICDLTPSVERRCKLLGLRVTSDRQGYFGYNDNFKAYIEVISFDRLLNAARERNRAFFDKLGLPTS